jgi:hypothetical protein
MAGEAPVTSVGKQGMSIFVSSRYVDKPPPAATKRHGITKPFFHSRP